MNGLFEGATGERMRKTVWLVLVMLAVLIIAQAVATLSGIRYIGAGIAAANTIQVSGHGEFDAAPDIATFTFSVVSDKSTAATAQADATAKQNAVSAYLKAQGISDKDIQTSGYSVYPQYEYRTASCPAASGGTPVYCPPGKQVLTGYEARQTTTIKVRDLAKAGDLLVGVGNAGATEVSGLNFTFDDPNQPQTEARAKAIADAKAKADALAKQLGVSIVRVTAFSENSGGNVIRSYAMDSQAMGKGAAPAAPTINPGQNTVQDDVTITYEIK